MNCTSKLASDAAGEAFVIASPTKFLKGRQEMSREDQARAVHRRMWPCKPCVRAPKISKSRKPKLEKTQNQDIPT